MIKKLFGGLLIAIAMVSFAMAQSNATKENNATAQKKAEQKIDKEAIKAAYKLLEVMNLEQFYKNAVNASTQRLVMANPAFKPIEGKIKAFYNKYIGWDAMKNDLAKLYAKYFNAKELADITAFYKTETGKKVLQNMPKLSLEGQMLTQSKLRPHLAELKALLDSAMKKAQKKQEEKTVASNSSKKEQTHK